MSVGDGESVLTTPTYAAGKVECMAASYDGFLLATASDDKSLKIFDIINFGKPATLHQYLAILILQT